MGIIERLGRVADTYVQERDQLIEAEQERRRVFTGHAFWPQEVLRDTIIAMSVLMVLSFYSWLIPPPLHNAADPFAQAGFVFPDWYVLFSYGYLRLGEYLPQFDIPLPTAIGNFFGTPIISWNAGWWGAAITGIPVTILALPPFLGGREKRGVEDPWFATAGMVYLAHVWFISVYSINIFLELYGKNRTDFCQMNSHAGLSCGTREPWIAEVFNSIPWLLTGVFVFAVLYFGIRWFMVQTQGARVTPNRNRNVAFGSLLIAVLLCSVTWPVYNNGFWDMGGFGAMQDIEELETLRSQPGDTLVSIEESHHHEHMMGLCLSYSESSKSVAWIDDHFDDGAWAYEDYCVMPAKEFTNWGIFQPTQSHIIDFNNANNHVDSTSGRNGLFNESIHPGSSDGSAVVHSYSGVMQVPNLGVDTLFVDVTCNARTTIRGSGEHTISLIVKDASGATLTSLDSCTTESMKLSSGTSYSLDYTISTVGLNETGNVITDVSITAFQPLILNDNGLAVDLSDINQLNILTGSTIYNADTLSDFTIENPTFEKNPKSLDAKLTYSLVIPCLGVGALVFFVMRGMARGYEYEMNKCYGCDLCDDACPVRLFNAGDKLNIIYNTWNNEDDGVPLYSCLTCTACTNACPQLVDYDSYIDIRRNLIVGGPPQAVIPHSILQAVIRAEAEDDADDQFVPIEEYPIDSSIGYYPGCVDYIDQEMIFSHVNEGSMNLGQTTDAAFTIFEDAEIDVAYLGRDFLKCCGHDQKWQGMTEVFEKLKAYNQKKLGDSGIETLVTSCAECFRTFALDYELDELKVMHTTEFLIESGYEFEAAVPEGTTVTYHDPCRLGRQMNLFEQPRDLVKQIDGVDLVEMEHHGEDALCCGVSSMMSCNEDSRALRIERFEEVRATGAEIMLTTCPKCVSHFECLKFEGDPRHDFEILDVVSFLARQIEEKKQA
ncbi:MAG: hypothetical protein CMB72_06530 [Euryarchaeota archaeon]|nr:hypothetical protein [Euryarchaeota archaeon]